MDQILLDCLRPTEKMIENIIQIEIGYINTTHPDFIKGFELLEKQQAEMYQSEEERLKNLQLSADQSQANNLQQTNPNIKMQKDSKPLP